MRVCFFMYIFIVIIIYTVSSIKIKRNIYYINNNILKNLYSNTNILKSHNKINITKEENYLKKLHSNISKIGNNIYKNINPFNIAVTIFTFCSLIGLLFKDLIKGKKDNIKSNQSNDENLFKYMCAKCNLVIYPAKGREQKFLKDDYICPNCGKSNMDKHNLIKK
ncbi:hypothetical protein PFMG_04778 [Plasmodium falciparum IGH-CR14]|nr:hypothetical protein PFNF135_05934 [Plasmodium falciparum NF135/5.C10]KNC37656.1 hypothetical protein PFLG_02780 [Plasmodium falciparum RAJ116]KNG78593.1 hypothetical protein PFMG_04778 [Plasmodium falciparum IGH-CR14]